mmetsp:Transcript_14676/g.19154  ORF Transcript_14676/g.19154 Transcript_14676/m.19154 type:complete len:518 (+) Transcript_14676:112-1665(+)|eukprot:CAMPEP_0198140286 /NCGR_PEP_ID=MMETSP1443-20131203/3456_1 /TAXON_ID=186043 /ORGANISM="Entomoneis sp., Strain CCMP2396" /LENGTH=517 /DNA_ID=CAMNT_0043802659 /DNA_START=801 /DNA_END=2354 /DNA_ORIENTATION=-
MFSFKAAFFASLIGGASASFPALSTYEPRTNVADHAAISMDQTEIQALVAFDSEASFDQAERIYREGGNSRSFAELTLSAALTQSIQKGDPITGTALDGTVVAGIAYADYSQGDLTIGLRYPTGQAYLTHVSCRVGALPASAIDTSQCVEESGSVTIDGFNGAVAYTSVVNKNGRTIAGFSTSANSKFRFDEDKTSTKDFYPFFQKFVDYYGTFDFADKIATAGFDGVDTSLANGNILLSGYSVDARAEIAKKGTAYINVGLYALREVYDAIDDCVIECGTEQCNDESVHALDEAVAFYVGSQYVSDPDGQGNLNYALAEKRAGNFATKEDGTSGQAEVNRLMMLEFNDMKSKLNAGQCPESGANAEEMVRLMQIPFIQGTMRYAYLLDNSNDVTSSEKQMAEGAIFAAGILPAVHDCNPATATIIYDNMKLTPSKASSADFGEVKRAFESVYSCLGVSCAEVGGLVDTATGTSYFTGAEACGGVQFGSTSGASAISASSMAVTAIGAVGAIATLFM